MRKVISGITIGLFIVGCGGGGSVNQPDLPVSTPSKLPTIILSVSKSEINPTQISVLSWSVSDATSCIGNNSWFGSQSISGTKNISYLEGIQTFELKCTGPEGTTSKSITITGKQPNLTFAGEWFPVDSTSLKDGYNGTVVGSFYNHIKIGTQSNFGLAITGWGYKGWDSKSNETAITKVGLFEPDNNGLLTLTNKYIQDSNTFGGASVIVADINGDQYQDIILVSHNETPILPQPTIIYYGSKSGLFTKKILNDKLAAHDAQLINVDGKPRIFTSVVTSHPRNAYYEFTNGELTPTYTPNISYYNGNFLQFGNMSQTVIENNTGSKVLVTAGGCRNPVGNCERTINIFPFNGKDITQTFPSQIVTPYLSTIDAYKNIVSADGRGQTHVYRVWSMDVNNDGHKDILAAQSMWNQDINLFPIALQVLQNTGNNIFVDKTLNLNSEIFGDIETLDPSPSFIDIDNTGIPAIFFGQVSFGNTSRQSNYVLLNDGTGKFHVALNNEFAVMTDNIFKMLIEKGFKFGISNPDKKWMIPKFIVVPQSDGSVNFLAELKTLNKNNINPETKANQVSHLYVNVPVKYNPTFDFIKNINIIDRNGSKKIRTWAGDDIIYDKDAALGTRIDGGLGKNKVIYSGASINYTISKNNDGSYRVISSSNKIDDTLIRIHNVVFSDKTITLE